MDQRLVAWGRAVKARRRDRLISPLWLFTDTARTPDPVAAAAALPAGLCGVVFRHDGADGRKLILRQLAAVCRARRLQLVVAGAAPLRRAGIGRHLRGGRGRAARTGLTTSSAHSRADLVRARRAGADLAFLSPAFPTVSHECAAALGPTRWARTARQAGLPVLALGGITGRNARRLPRWVAGAGAIGALLP